MSLLCLGLLSFHPRPALADEHIIFILASAYFPQETAVAEGDRVRFINASGQDHTVAHAGGAWVTVTMADGDELIVAIEKGMTGQFYGEASKQITGQLDLLRAPLTR